jgi:hypothetical protein
MQLMLYKFLFDQMVNADTDMARWTALGVDLTRPFSADMRSVLGMHDETLSQLITTTLTRFRRLGCASDSLKIEYHWQHDCSLLGVDIFQHDPTLLSNLVDRMLPLWSGTRTPDGVTLADAWKCQRCHHAESCTWRAEKAMAFSNK